MQSTNEKKARLSDQVSSITKRAGLIPLMRPFLDQLRVLDERVRRKREIFEVYRRALDDLPGIYFMPEAPWGLHNRWPACA